MRYRQGLNILAIVLLLAVAACAKSDPEQALRQQLAQMQAAIETRDSAELQRSLAEDFIGNEGMDRRQARAMAMMLMQRHQSLGVTFGPMDVRMQPPGNATVSFTAMTTGGSGALIPEQMQAYAVETAWREIDGDWRLYHAAWSPRL